MKSLTMLVIVESPNKTAKIAHLLGPGYVVVATLGHLRDLPEDSLGVDEATLAPTYEVLRTKSQVLQRLRAEASKATEVLLATDADREGEAIAWHVAEALHLRSPRRIRFQELSAVALRRAVSGAGQLDLNLVDAQQARRVVDRLVGYQVSPLLRVFGSNHSAGRVQSATLHLVCTREAARVKFSPVAFWSLTAVYEAFSAKWAIRNEAGVWVSARAGTQAQVLHAQAEGERHRHVVEQVESKPVEQRPKPPFTTSTLQQTASARLNFKPDKTMTVAQSLFEVGAITYHRTDSVALSDEAIALAREWISKVHPSALPNSPVRYRAAAQSQEAHEAVRPTAANVDAATKLTADEAALLDLIRLRFFASQCAPAVIQRTTIRIRAGEAHFVAIGSVVTVPSFLKFLECDEEKDEPKVEERANLPLLEVGQQLAPIRFAVAAESTKPLPRFTQATLVREMERCGIGRPSTFASTLKTLFDRNYIGEEKKSVVPTPRGQLIDGAVSASFPKIVDAEYTALMERRLDEVATGRRRWKEELREWHGSFSGYLREAPGAIAKWMEANRDLVDAASDASRVTDKTCPRCGLALVLRQGKTGPFLACSGFPACAYSADPSVQGSVLKCPNCDGSMEELDGKFGHWARCVRASCAGRRGVARNTDDACPRCKSPMLDKGEFLGCSQFPACRFSVDRKLLQKALKKARSCPKCTRLFVEKKGPRGKFLSCVGYPECRHTQAVPAKKGKAHV